MEVKKILRLFNPNKKIKHIQANIQHTEPPLYKHSINVHGHFILQTNIKKSLNIITFEVD